MKKEDEERSQTMAIFKDERGVEPSEQTTKKKKKKKKKKKGGDFGCPRGSDFHVSIIPPYFRIKKSVRRPTFILIKIFFDV